MPEPIGNPRMRLVDSVERAGEFLSWLGERRPILAIDTETAGLDWYRSGPFCRMVQFGDGDNGWAVPVRNWRGVAEKALTVIRDDRVATAWWNPKFDFHALEVEGLPLPFTPRAHDGYTMHHLLHSEKRHGLKPVGEMVYGDVAGMGDRLLKMQFSEHKWGWDTVPDDWPAYWQYAAFDPVLTAKLVEGMWPRVQMYREAYDREMAALWILYRAEARGMRVDVTYSDMLRNDWLSRAADLGDGLRAEGIANPNSNKQITDALKAAGWEPDEFTPKGAVKLDKAILLELQRVFPGDTAERILELRRLLKWSGTYLTPFIESGGRVHPDIRVLGARTGRMSIANPPLQQLPAKGEGGKLIRRAVLPEEGHVLYATDYDGQELRYHAHISDSSAMIEAFRQGIDPHSYAASLGFNIPIEDVTKDMRDPFKNFRYGKLYGAGNERLARTGGISVAEVERVAAVMDAAFPEERPFAERLEQLAQERWADEGEPYVMTWGGRKVVGEGDKLYALLNYTIQGSCADILKDRLIHLNAAGLADYMVVPVHDEILWSFPAEDAADLAREAAGIMTMDTQFKVPLTVGIDGPLDTWGEKYE